MAQDTEFAAEALSANNQTFSMDALQAAQVNSFDRILSRLSNQSQIQRNQETPAVDGESPDGTHTLYISRIDFDRLQAEGPRLYYILEGTGASSRPQGAIDEGLVDQVVLHSFGYSIDRVAVIRGARSIQVDSPEIGHNPYKVSNRMQQILQQPRQSTSHLITRRGDIICATPWNRCPAVNRFSSMANNHVERRSISIELESWHTTYKTRLEPNREDDFKIIGLMPYTPQQLTSLAFILRKFSVWANGGDMTYALGFTRSELSAVLGEGSSHIAGIAPLSAITGVQTSPGGEFVLPAAWKLGDQLPPWLSSKAAAWTQRHNLYYRNAGWSEGSPISAFAAVRGTYDALPTYSLAAEVFENREDHIFAAAAAGDGASASASAAIIDAGEGYSRSQEMTTMQRSGLYAAAPVAADAVITAAQIAQAQRMAAAFTSPAIPVVQRAVSFDFSTGRWGTTTVRSASPATPAPTAAPEDNTPPASHETTGLPPASATDARVEARERTRVAAQQF